MPPELQDGAWYVVTDCDECQQLIVLFRDLNNGRGSVGATYTVKCPYCREAGAYVGRHYQHFSSPAKKASG